MVLRSKYFLVSIFFLLNSSLIFNISLFAEVNSSKNKFQVDLGPEYLNYLPLNDYIIGPGDSLTVSISRDYPELFSDSNVVDGEGTIYLPRLNRVYVSGLTVNELNNILNKAYQKFVKYPDVEVTLQAYRPIRVFVEGEVESPGLQTLEGSISISRSLSKFTDITDKSYLTSTTKFSNNLKDTYFFPTVFDAIQSSGGITEFSDLSNIQVIRKNKISAGGGEITTTLDFRSLLTSGDKSQNIRIYDADIIKIKKSDKSNRNLLTKAVLSNLNPKFLSVFVSGRVNIPGSTLVSKASVLNDAIDMAGGAKVLKGPTTFVRFNNDGTIDKRKFNLNKRAKRGSYKNPLLKEGDLIIIGESLLTSTNQVLTEITSPFLGIFSTYGLVKAISID